MTINVLTLKDSTKTIKLIRDAGKKLDERIHLVGVSGMAHFFGIDGDGNVVNDGGDLTALTDLTHAMPRSARGNAFKYWVTKHLPVKWDKKAYGGNGGWKKNGKFEGDAYEVLWMANNAPFYEKTDTEQAEFNADKYLATVANKIRKEIANGADIDVADFMAKLEAKLAA